MALAGGARLPQERALASDALKTLARSAASASGGRLEAAHEALLAQDIRRFLERPAASLAPPSVPLAPTGPPIGQPALIFRKRRELLLDLSQCGAEALSEYMRRGVGADARPGIVVSIATAGDLLQWHVHLHVLATDGAFSDDATFHPLAARDGEALMRLFRERLLARLALKHAISQELVTKLMAWRHPGFSAHIADPIR